MAASDANDTRTAAALDQGLLKLAIDLDPLQRERLLAFIALLQQWNRAFNLTAVRDPLAMVSRHLLDSLSIWPWVDQGPVLDVGTGPGLPGIPLAVARPGLPFSLIDSNRKKTRFVQQAVAELGLDNVEVLNARVESLDRPGHYARITSRAFAALGDMVIASRPLLAAGGAWLAMKGQVDNAELDTLPAGLRYEVLSLPVVGPAATRHLVRVSRAAR